MKWTGELREPPKYIGTTQFALRINSPKIEKLLHSEDRDEREIEQHIRHNLKARTSAWLNEGDYEAAVQLVFDELNLGDY
jgi:hypothetical protein